MNLERSVPDEDNKTVIEVAHCPEHGDYEQYHVQGVEPNGCAKCIDARAAAQTAQATQAKQDVANRVRRKALVAANTIAAQIPMRFADRSLAGYEAKTQEQRMTLAICRAYANNWESQLAKGGSLVLTGQPGTGKTHLACAIANQIIPENAASVLFCSVSSMMRAVRATYGKTSNKTEAQAIADLRTPDLLIVDEIGAQSGSDHEMQTLFDVINSRYQELRPMILISNLNTTDLEKFLGQRAMDRFRECGTVLAFDWESHRGLPAGAQVA